MPSVVIININKEHKNFPPDDYVYIGRIEGKEDCCYGNPFSHLPMSLATVKVKTKKQAVKSFRDWLFGRKYRKVEPARRAWIRKNIYYLNYKILGCYCDVDCHGQVLEEYLIYAIKTRNERIKKLVAKYRR